jgi:hypothetical protein
MSSICNRILALDEKLLEEKSSLGLSVSISVHAALSNFHKASEILETNRAATGAEVVYLRAAVSKLEAAAQALRKMRDILTQGSLSEAATAWLDALDYDRLYAAGRERGQIPAVIEQWNRLVNLKKPLDPVVIANCLISDVEDLQKKAQLMVNTLLSGTTSASLTVEQVERLCDIHASIINFSCFAQMVSYLNAVEPMDTRWCRQSYMASSPRNESDRKNHAGSKLLQ